MKDNIDIRNSYNRIRKLVGFLGLLLPIIIVVGYWGFLPSISLFYYTRSAVFFIAILAAFALLLISYEGYEHKKSEKGLSDNIVSHIGGFAILIVVLVPTCCKPGFSICQVCPSEGFCLFGHTDKTIDLFHLLSAGIFFFFMGYMSIVNFRRGTDHKYHFMYKLCGYVIWFSLLLLIIEFIIRKFINENFYVTPYDVYIMETIMVFAFAISWLLKGRTLEYIAESTNKLIKRLK